MQGNETGSSSKIQLPSIKSTIFAKIYKHLINPKSTLKSKCNRLISMGLLIVFTFYLSCYFVAFGVMRFSIRMEAKQRMKKSFRNNEMILFTPNQMSNNGFRWTEQGKEFSYQNEMYDVVKITKDRGEVQYYCITDNKESRLLDGFVQLVENNHSKHNASNHPASKLIEILFHQHFLISETDSNFPEFASSKISLYKFTSFESQGIDVLTPPPEGLDFSNYLFS